MSAECAIGGCGIQAVGRCATCDNAFCGSHQARTDLITYADLCDPCLVARASADKRYDLENGYQFIFGGGARATLSASGAQAVELHTIVWTAEKQSFRRRMKSISRIEPMGRGWLLGNFSWDYYYVDSDDSRYQKMFEEILTVLLDTGAPYPTYSSNGIARVVKDPDRDGYILQTSDGMCNARWTEIGAAVHRVAGTK